MKLCLGMINYNDKELLQHYLPIVRPCFDGAIVVDAESTDGSQEVFKKHDFTIIGRKWNDNYSDARNLVIKTAEELGYTHLFMLDADESMFPKDIRIIKQYLKDNEFIWLPRIEFVKDNKHFNPELYPDFQCRVFKLGIHYHYQNRVHEMLFKGEDKVVARKTPVYPLKLPDCHIYHYGSCISKEKLWLKRHNYDRIEIGLPVLKEVPKDTMINEEKLWGCKPAKFYGRQPRCK